MIRLRCLVHQAVHDSYIEVSTVSCAAGQSLFVMPLVAALAYNTAPSADQKNQAVATLHCA